MKRIRKSNRGLTFSIDENNELIGTKYRYIVDKKKGEVVIIPDNNGKMTVSRKKCGKKYKPLYDIRSKEVRELCRESSYMEVEVLEEKIIVHTYKEIKRKIHLFKNNIIDICDIIGEKTGEIVLNRASGDYIGRATLQDDNYFSYLCSNLPIKYTGNKKKELKKVYDVISLFSGAGLLDYSFKDPQFRFLYAVDFDKNACMTYKENIGKHIQCEDIRKIDSSMIPNADLIIGGPCCQGYSNANRSNIGSTEAEKKRLLVDDYIRITKDKHPKVFVIENVPQFLTKENGLYIKKVLEELSEYEITCTVVQDYKVGGYTARKRAIVIGSRIGKIELPDAELCTVKTVRDALSQVDTEWFNYKDVTEPRPETVERMKYVPQGGNWKDVPESVHKFGPKTHSNTYRRLAWNEISPTIINWRKCLLTHPEENRILTVSEAAALMGLDKNFKILGDSLDSRQQQVGNGVTQAIGKFVKKYILEALNKSEKILQFA